MKNYYYRNINLSISPFQITPVVRNLLIANVAVFLLQIIFYKMPIGHDKQFIENFFGITPGKYINNLFQIFTYMFVHSTDAKLHIVFNMIYLWMFGVEVERKLGSRSFAWLYFICGIGAGVISALFFTLFKSFIPVTSVYGASGAVFGIMLAFGLLFPDGIILMFFVIPVRAIHLVMFMIAGELVYMLFLTNSNVAHVTHVTGALFAYIYLLNEKAILKSAPRADTIQRVREKIETISEAEEQRRIDDILDKINREGMHKLSRSERAFLRRRAAKRRQD